MNRWQLSPLVGTVYPNGAWDDELRIMVCDGLAEAMLWQAILVQMRELEAGRTPREGEPARIGDRIVVSRDASSGVVYRTLSYVGGNVASHSSIALAKAYVGEKRRRAA